MQAACNLEQLKIEAPNGTTLIEQDSLVGCHPLKLQRCSLRSTESPTLRAVLPSLSLPDTEGSKRNSNVVDGHIPTEVGHRENLQSNVRTRHV